MRGLAEGETVEYEVWRTHLRGGPDVCLYHGLSKDAVGNMLAMCEKGKAEAYPDAPVEFFIVCVTSRRVRITEQAGR